MFSGEHSANDIFIGGIRRYNVGHLRLIPRSKSLHLSRVRRAAEALVGNRGGERPISKSKNKPELHLDYWP